MSAVLSFMENLNQVKMFMLKCLWVSLSILRMGPEKSFNWREPFMDFVKVFKHFGSISLKSSKPVKWNNSNLIPVSLLEPKWFVLSMLTTSSFGVKTQRISIAQQCKCVSLVLTLTGWQRHRVSWSHVGTVPRNRFSWNEANWTDQTSYQSTWIGWWTSQLHSIWIQTVGQEYQWWSSKWGFQLQQCSGYASVSIWTHPPWYHFCCQLLCLIHGLS